MEQSYYIGQNITTSTIDFCLEKEKSQCKAMGPFALQDTNQRCSFNIIIQLTDASLSYTTARSVAISAMENSALAHILGERRTHWSRLQSVNMGRAMTYERGEFFISPTRVPPLHPCHHLFHNIVSNRLPGLDRCTPGLAKRIISRAAPVRANVPRYNAETRVNK